MYMYVYVYIYIYLYTCIYSDFGLFNVSFCGGLGWFLRGLGNGCLMRFSDGENLKVFTL